jgi:hypothetical protein
MNGEIMSTKIANLCLAYDGALSASRDPKCRERQDYYLALVVTTRKSIEQMVNTLMVIVRNGGTTTDGHSAVYCDVPLSVAELTYFNTWFNLRGGWSG